MKRHEAALFAGDADVPARERLRVFLLLIAAGGFLGAYTYVLKGGVFCNAQTANCLLFAVRLGQGEWRRALYYLIPISAYLGGAVLAALLPRYVERAGGLPFDALFVLFEMAALLALGFVPDDAPPQICQVAVNFLASMQFATFRQARRVPMATTFCTNHIRQAGTHLVGWLRDRDADARMRFLMHAAMILAFVAGALAGTLLCGRFQGRAIWWAELPLALVLFDLLREARRGRA